MPPKLSSVKRRRGRKPRGGTVCRAQPVPKQSAYVRSVVVQLNCRKEDLKSNESSEGEIQVVPASLNNIQATYTPSLNPRDQTGSVYAQSEERSSEHSTLCQPEVSCACFWCTYPFSTVAVHIPKHRTQMEIEAYGNFCSPQCAAAHLFADRSIDESDRMERYHLLNSLYSTNGHSIRPAPSPHYTLKKFQGAYSIGEYRNLFELQQNVLVIERPLTVLKPDIVFENDPLARESSVSGGYSLSRSSRGNSKLASLVSNFKLGA